jgi:radical SAM superfamily enzyme YgiQ (UPF0313 family)
LPDAGRFTRTEREPHERYAALLGRVQRPGRYVGGEFNLRRKPAAEPLVVLSYPDVYEIGVSNPALQILYSQINDGTPAAAERAYCPWPDMADLMRQAGARLWTLETARPVREAALWGFTLPHELTYTNVLEMLDLAGVPLRSAERGAGDPIVMGGGPATANPLPLAPFFDAFFIGEVEGRLNEIVAAAGAGSRAARLAALAAIPGVWLPSRPVTRPIPRPSFGGFSASMPVTRPLVPLLEAVHDRVVLEVARGCTAGCRFCQAGMWYRPVRERPVETIVAAAKEALRHTGCDEVSLLSLSSCDYSGIEEVVRRLRSLQPGLRVSLPSLRVDSAAVNLARLGTEQRGSITLAPEAGTQRLRDAINKRVDDAMLLEATTATFRAGFTGLKLYFMIGLPGEEDDDVRGIAKLAAAVQGVARALAGGRARVSAAVSAFVPKAATAFQWERFAGEDEVLRRQRVLREVWPRGVKLALHDARAAAVEARLAVGGERLGDLVEAAWRQGARFDGWSEYFSLEHWESAATRVGIDLRSPDAAPPLDGKSVTSTARLPWERVIDSLVDPGFLASERRRAADTRLTEDCRLGDCSLCGVCRPGVNMELAR